MKVRYRVSLALFFVFLFVFTVIAGGSYLVCHYHYFPMIKEVHYKFEKHKDAFLADIKYLEENPLFKVSPRENNFEFFYLDYWGALTSNNFMGRPGLTKEYEQYEELYLPDFRKEDWIDIMMKDKGLMALDVSWMEKILEYDHWDFFVSKALFQKIKDTADKNNIKKIGVWSQLPIPDFSRIQFAATVFLLQSKKKGELNQGLKVLNHLSFLFANSHSLVAGMMAVSNMKLLNLYVERFKGPQEYLIPAKSISAFKRSSWGWAGVLRRYDFEEMPEEFSKYIKPGSNACYGVMEGNIGALMFSDYLSGSFPFEYGFPEIMALEKERRKKWFEVCGLQVFNSWLRTTGWGQNPWVNRDFSEVEFGESANSLPFSFNYSRLPYIRPILGLIMLTIATPDFMRLYDEEN